MLRLAVAASVFAFASPVFAAPVEWEVDPSHSRVGFWVKHLGITKVRGDFKQFEAKVMADAKTGKIEALDATVKTASVNTENERRDNHLRSDDFFNSDKFPDMKLKLKKITWNGNNFSAEVDLTIRGTTKPVSFTGEQAAVQKVNFGNGPRVQTAYSATAKINRKDYGLNWAKVVEAVPVVGDDVAIELEIEMGRKGE